MSLQIVHDIDLNSIILPDKAKVGKKSQKLFFPKGAVVGEISNAFSRFGLSKFEEMENGVRKINWSVAVDLVNDKPHHTTFQKWDEHYKAYGRVPENKQVLFNDRDLPDIMVDRIYQSLVRTKNQNTGKPIPAELKLKFDTAFNGEAVVEIRDDEDGVIYRGFANEEQQKADFKEHGINYMPFEQAIALTKNSRCDYAFRHLGICAQGSSKWNVMLKGLVIRIVEAGSDSFLGPIVFSSKRGAEAEKKRAAEGAAEGEAANKQTKTEAAAEVTPTVDNTEVKAEESTSA